MSLSKVHITTQVHVNTEDGAVGALCHSAVVLIALQAAACIVALSLFRLLAPAASTRVMFDSCEFAS